MESDYASQYSALYHKHWWWRARESVLCRELKQLNLSSSTRILDVGCGDGLSFPLLRKFGVVEGIETDKSLLNPNSPHRSKIFTEPLGRPLYEGRRYDVITAFDVLEHIDDDRSAIRNINDMLEPGGWLVLTVPAFMCLWDGHDEINLHYRRYRADKLRAELQRYFQDLRVRYLFQSLFIPKLMLAMLNRLRDNAMPQHRIPSRWLNEAVQKVLEAEYLVVRRIPLPFGTSLLAVGQKHP